MLVVVVAMLVVVVSNPTITAGPTGTNYHTAIPVPLAPTKMWATRVMPHAGIPWEEERGTLSMAIHPMELDEAVQQRKTV